MTRRLLGVALVSIGLAFAMGGAPARADAPMGAGTVSFDLRFYDKGNMQFGVVNPDQVFFHLNRATCLCAEHDPANPLYQMGVYQKLTGVTTPLHNPMSVYVATTATCDDTAINTNKTCVAVPGVGINDFNAISVNGFFLAQIPTNLFIEQGLQGCAPATGSHDVFDIVNTGGNFSVGNVAYDYDTQAPPPAVGFNAVGGENAIQITFTPPTGGSTDVLWYQALCSTVDGAPAFTKHDDPKYVTSHELCGLEQEVPLDPAPVAVSGPDAQVADGNPTPDGPPDGPPGDASTGPAPDARPAPTGLPAGLASLDPTFICGTQSGTGSDMRITGLKNYTQYRVVFLAIDKYGNAAGTYMTDAIMPKPVTDFWEDTHDEGSQVESGFCLISDTYGDGGPITNAMRAFRDDTLGASAPGRALTRFYYAHVAWLGQYARAHWPVRLVLAIVLLPAIVVALVWHVLTLPGLLALVGVAWWLRRRRRGRSSRLAIASTAALVLLAIGGGAAHAQDDEAYWMGDTDSAADADVGPVEPDWIVGIKLGPYVPDIDAQFHAQAAPTYASYFPYRHMFGGYNIMPVIEVDRVLLRRMGQLTVGGSFGYLGKIGHTYLDGSLPGPERPTATDTNAFRMVPLTAELGYRFTYLDDRYGIPIVPYAKGGLAYTLWWMRNPNGEFSSIGPDNCHAPGWVPGAPCPTAKETAIGGSMGLVGSVGISIRAERIDSDAASSMRSGGVQHAGFYAELQASWVDSFGSSKRLSLGDKTWFAGFDFEF